MQEFEKDQNEKKSLNFNKSFKSNHQHRPWCKRCNREVKTEKYFQAQPKNDDHGFLLSEMVKFSVSHPLLTTGL